MFSATARCAKGPEGRVTPAKPKPRKVRIHQPRRLPRNNAPAPASPSYYWDTAVPTPEQLWRAERFFWKAPPTLLFSSTEFRNVKATNLPEVAFLGRSNVGKSSILNALMGKEICHTSSKPGRTRSMNFFAAGGEDGQGSDGKLAVLDMPGYGKGSREEWGPEIMKYLIGRKQLRRAFLLVDALHGLKPSDEEVLSLFRKHAISHQIILSKVDRVLFQKSTPSVARMERNVPQLDAIVDKLKPLIQPGKGDGPEALGEVITCSAEKTIDGTKVGINNVRWAVLAATGLGDERRKILPSEIATQAAMLTNRSELNLRSEGQPGIIDRPQQQDLSIGVPEKRSIAHNPRNPRAIVKLERRRSENPSPVDFAF